MLRELRRLQRRWVKVGWPALEIGVGINSGVTIAGNVGSPRRMQYTVIGDDVKLAHQLQELNKEFDTNI